MQRFVGPAAYVASRSLFLTPAEQARPDHIRTALIATLFGSAANVATLAFAAVVCGWLAYARSGCALSVAIATLEVLVIAARCGVILSFKRAGRLDRLGDADVWLCRFGWLALASSFLWGSLCFLALASAHDAVLYAIPVMSTVGIAGSVAARNSAGLVILIQERNAQLLALIETRHELDLLSRIDAVTGIANRRTFDDQLRRRVAAGTPFALLMVDIDRFKRFNDTFGHPTGDLMLLRIATILRSEMRRPEDLVARYGGEEFAILVDDVDVPDAASLAERIRRRVKETFATAVPGGRMTVSIGLATSDLLTRAPDIVQQADEALYRAKRTGRDRVAVSRSQSAVGSKGNVADAA